MILIDANILLYAYDSSAQNHRPARAWFEQVMSKPEPVGLSWITILAFLRLSTDRRVFLRPLSINESLKTVSEWLSLPTVHILSPTDRHFEILTSLLAAGQASGPLVMDGHLAALAIEHGAVVQTTDRDFTRFPGLRFANPLERAEQAEK
jgi:toxin-antitoxin system PIN domain toxin